MTLSKKNIQEFQSYIRKWRAINRRDLPWRKTTDPYAIWISETMLCQTQVSRVIVYFNNRMRQFPTVYDLAQASTTEILSARSGLGYNSRWLRIRLAAQAIVASQSEANNNSFPTTYTELLSLPGVGDYVANAILVFAYHQDVAVIDTNIRRILIHHFSLDEKTSLQDLKVVALKILPKGYACEWYNALMDYGALELTSKKTGIRPVSRQSKFEWSRRQVRAWIVREIVNGSSWVMNYLEIQRKFPDRNDIQGIIDDMIRENIIEIIDWKLTIKS